MRAPWNEHGTELLGWFLQVWFAVTAGIAVAQVLLVASAVAEVGYLLTAVGCLLVAVFTPWEPR